MRNSALFWEKTARIGDLCWVQPKFGIKWSLGIVIDIRNYDYWDPSSYPNWIYIILTSEGIVEMRSRLVEKILEEE